MIRPAIKKGVLILVILVLLLLIRLVENIGFEQEPADRYLVTKVLDGDTMELLGGDRIRLLSVDTPERGDPLYDSACRFLATLALGKSIQIEFSGRRRDRYGRLLGYAYVDDTLLINQRIVEQGLGYLYLFDDQELLRSEVSRMLHSQRLALSRDRGLWGLPYVPEERYLAANNSLRFHRPGCRHAQDWSLFEVRQFDSRSDALYEGLSPCRQCKP